MRVNTTDLQNAFGKYLALADKEDIIVVKNGRSVAKLSKYREPDYVLVHEEANRYKAQRKISYEEYLELVESTDQRYELIDGEIYLLASPSFNHQVIVSELAVRFHHYFRGKSCCSLTAPLDITLFGFALKFEEDPNVVQPDLVVICDQDKVNEDGRYEGIPTLIVEVLSPSTKGKDMVTKLHIYMKSGVLEYWLVDPENKRIMQYAFTGERDVLSVDTFSERDTVKSVVFTGLDVPLAEVFNCML